MDNDIKKLLNEQINAELYSAYLYIQFSNMLYEEGYTGFAHWYSVQSQEELEHAEKFMHYLHDCGECVTLTQIAAPGSDYETLDDILHEGLRHEEYITSLINNIYRKALEEHDYRTMKFLDWFIAEQHEEEVNAKAMIDKYQNFVCDCGCGLYELDKELSERS